MDELHQLSNFIAHIAFTIVKTYVESNGTKDYYLQNTTNSCMYNNQSACSLLAIVLHMSKAHTFGCNNMHHSYKTFNAFTINYYISTSHTLGIYKNASLT